MVLARVVRVRGRGVDVGVCVVYDKPIEGAGGGKDGGKDGGEGGDWGEGNVCGEEWQGVIRREDVRATERDGVVCKEGFRVGDVVRGVVVCSLSFGFGFDFLVLGDMVGCMCVRIMFGKVRENWVLMLMVFHVCVCV